MRRGRGGIGRGERGGRRRGGEGKGGEGMKKEKELTKELKELNLYAHTSIHVNSLKINKH